MGTILHEDAEAEFKYLLKVTELPSVGKAHLNAGSLLPGPLLGKEYCVDD